jgi:hypothetical protein
MIHPLSYNRLRANGRKRAERRNVSYAAGNFGETTLRLFEK